LQAIGQQVGVALLVMLMGIALFNDFARQFG
jgi:membrane-associated protease RseP (regulator of RpoE activity)